MDLGFLGQGIPLNYSEAYGINDLSHVVGNSAIGTAIRRVPLAQWPNDRPRRVSGQVVSEARRLIIRASLPVGAIFLSGHLGV